MADKPKIREQYLDFTPPLILYGSVELLLRYVPPQYLAELHTITLTNSAALRKSWRGKVSWEGRRVRASDCRGAYGRGHIILVVDQMFDDFPEIFLLLPLIKRYLIARTLYHEIGHHIHKLEQPGYRAEKEMFADEWRDKLLRDFLRQRYSYFGFVIRGLAKMFPSLRHRDDARASESAEETL